MKIRILSPKDNEALWQIIRHELETHNLALPGIHTTMDYFFIKTLD